MAWAVKALVKSVLGKARHGGSSAAMGESSDATGSRVRLLVKMEAASAGTVEITADMSLQDVRVELHLTKDGEPGTGAKGGDGVDAT